MGGIEAAGPIRRDAEADAFAPAERALIVVVEMDGAVLVGCGFPIVHRAGPVRSRHGACGQVDEAGMGCVRAGIGGGLGWDADGEIPCRQCGIRRRRAMDGRAFQLAVVVGAGRCVALGWQRREENLRRAGRRTRCIRAGLAGIAERCARRLCHSEIAVDAERGRHVVPSPFQQSARHFRAHACAIRTGDFRHRAARRTDAERERPSIDPQRDQTLPAFTRSGRPDRRRKAHAAAQIDRQ